MIALRMKIYIDYWNMQCALRQVAPNATIRWQDLGAAAIQAAQKANPAWAGMSYKGGEVFTSRPSSSDAGSASVRKMGGPGLRVHVSPRKAMATRVFCKQCGTTTASCPGCGAPFLVEKEKGVDMDLCVTVFDDLCDGTCDGIILASGDEDFVPMVASLRRRGIPVINLGFRHGGHPLSHACDATVRFEDILPNVAFLG